MKNKKYPLLLWVLLISFLASIVNVLAHPGSLDSNGGHWDRKNGTYHFHEGKNTSGTSTPNPDYEYPYSDFEPPSEPPTDNPSKGDKEVETVSDTGIDIKHILENILTVVICIWAIVVFILWDLEKNNGCLTFGISTVLLISLTGYLIEEKTGLFLGLILITVILILTVLKLKRTVFVAVTNIDKYTNSLYRLDKLYKELFRINSQSSKAHENIYVPDLYEIGTDNLPKDKNSISGWGKSFTLYKSNNGTKLHTNYNCCSAINPLHLYHCRNYRDFSKLLCKKCANDYVIPDISWYEDYLKYERLTVEQQNIEKNCVSMQKEIDKLYKQCNSIRTKILMTFSRKTKKALQEANYKYKEMQVGQQLQLFDCNKSEDLL